MVSDCILKDYVKATKKLDSNQKIYFTDIELQALGAAKGDILEVLVIVKKKAKGGNND